MTDPWKSAIKQFENELTQEEKIKFSNARPEDILRDITVLEETQRKSSRFRRVSIKIKPLLDTIEDYGKAIDVLANSSSVLPPLWGSLRVLLHAAQKYNDYFSKLIDMLERIGDVLPRYSTYSKLLDFHAPLQSALQDAHGQIIVFFVRAKSVLSLSPARILLRTLRGSFDKAFEDCMSQLRRYRELVEDESKLASVILQVEENKRAEEERSRANQSRRQVERLELLAEKRGKEENLRWLNARKCSEEKGLLEDCRLKGTCEWVLQREEVSKWIQFPDTQLLWLHGAPGCGKSYLYGRLLSHLETDKPVLYFLFCGGDKERVTLSSLLRSWCLQLLELFPEMMGHLESVKNTHKPPVATDKDIMKLFKLLLEKSPTLYLSVDAIDECVDGDQFFKQIAFVPKRYKILVTSRTPADIRKDLAKIRIPLQTLQIEPELSKADIDNFIDARLNEADFRYSEGTMNEIRNRLTICDGMFLWVKLMIEHLESQTCEFDMLRCLKELPEGLPQTYERILGSINSLPASRRLLAYKVFLWVLTARRPIAVAELRCLLAVQPASDAFDERRLIPDAESTILSVCGGLLQSRGTDKKIYFTHFTATEYMQGHVLQSEVFQEILACYDASDLKSNESLAAAVCLRYLCYDFVGKLLPPQNYHEASRLFSQDDTKLSLLSYAVSFWFEHLRKVDVMEQLVIQLAQQLLNRGRPNLDVCWHLYWFFGPESSNSSICPSFSALHVAAYFGLPHLVSVLLPEYTSDVVDSAGRSPLWWTASRGDADTTQLLLKAGFDPDSPDQNHIAPVHRAAANGHFEVFKAIISFTKPSDSLVTDSEGWTPLHWAASRGQEPIMGYIIWTYGNKCSKYGNNSHRCHAGRTALHYAALNGHDHGLFRFESGVGLNRQDHQGCTALHLAAQQGHKGVVEWLISHDADQTILDNSGQTALMTAEVMGNEDICSMLTLTARLYGDQSGPNVDTIQRIEGNISRYEKIVRPSLNSRDMQEVDTLGAIISGRKSDLVFLVLKGREWRRADDRNRTPLHHAAALGYLHVVQEIIRYAKEGTPQSHEPAMNEAERQDFFNQQDDRGWTALHYSAAGRSPSVCKLLLIEGASAHPMTPDSLTAYDLAINEGHTLTIEAIARYSPLPSTQIAKDFGWESIHIGARDGTLTKEDVDTAHTGDLQTLDRFRRTPLFRATEIGRRSVAELLLDKTTLSIKELLDLAIVAEESGHDDGLVRLFLQQMKPDSLLLEPSQQGLAQFILRKVVERNDVSAVTALCDAGVRFTNCLAECRWLSNTLNEDSTFRVAMQNDVFDVANFLIQRGVETSEFNPAGTPILYVESGEMRDLERVPVIGCLQEYNDGSSHEDIPDTLRLHILYLNASKFKIWSDALTLARRLLGLGASLVTITPSEEYPAWLAIHRRPPTFSDGPALPFSDVRRLMEEHACDILAELPDKQGFLPIHDAASEDMDKLRNQLKLAFLRPGF